MSVFSIFNDKTHKKKIEQPSVSEYYSKLALRARIAKILVFILLAVFVLLSFTFNGNELTLDNFRYLIKFIQVDTSNSVDNGDLIFFDSSNTNRAITVRGDLAVLSENGLNVYDMAGTHLSGTTFHYDNPTLLTNGKNIIAYDLGGYELRAFTSYDSIFKKSYEYPVYGVETNALGYIGVISSEKGYRSGITVYDEYFRVIFSHFFGDLYLQAIDIDDAGKTAAAASIFVSNGDICTSLSRYGITEDNETNIGVLTNEYPLKLSFAPDGTYALLTDKAYRLYSSDNTLINEMFFDKNTLSGYLFGEKYDIITYSVSPLTGEIRLCVYDKTSAEIFSMNFSSGVNDFLIKDDRLYVLTFEKLHIIDLNNKEKATVSTVSGDVLSLVDPDDDYLLLFSNSSTLVYKE